MNLYLNDPFRQDAVQDLIEHPTFEADFTRLVKGMPDLERMVSRIHAKNCKVRDFLKVLEVSDDDYAQFLKDDENTS